MKCGDEQFRCSDSRCIAASERCDGYQDCDNDEDDCPLPSLETTTSSPITTTEEENVGFTDLVETTSPWTETETEEVPVVQTTETGSRPECNVTCAEVSLQSRSQLPSGCHCRCSCPSVGTTESPTTTPASSSWTAV